MAQRMPRGRLRTKAIAPPDRARAHLFLLVLLICRRTQEGHGSEDLLLTEADRSVTTLLRAALKPNTRVAQTKITVVPVRGGGKR